MMAVCNFGVAFALDRPSANPSSTYIKVRSDILYLAWRSVPSRLVVENHKQIRLIGRVWHIVKMVP